MTSRTSYIRLSLFLHFLLLLHVRAGLYYDQQTCSGDATLLDSAFVSAFKMIERALETIGQPPHQPQPEHSTELWNFPDQEAGDLAARIFGGAQQSKPELGKEVPSLTERLKLVKANYQYMLNHFQPPNGAGTLIGDEALNLGQRDILVYCDLSRLQPAGENWGNPGREQEGYVLGDVYSSCKKGNTLAFTAKKEDIAQVMYICSIDKVRKKRYQIMPDRDPIFMQYQKTPGDICKKLLQKGRFEVDYYCEPLLDCTLLHEMTHCIISARDNGNDKPYTLLRTDDFGKGGGYHWKNVHALREDYRSRNNADSYANYGIGAWMLRTKHVRIKNNGCLEDIPNYTPGTANSEPVVVDAQWSFPAQKRRLPGDEQSTENERIQTTLLNPLEVRQFVTSASLAGSSSANNSEIWNTTNVRSLPTSQSTTAASANNWNSSVASVGVRSSTEVLTSLSLSAFLSGSASSTISSGLNFSSPSIGVIMPSAAETTSVLFSGSKSTSRLSSSSSFAGPQLGSSKNISASQATPESRLSSSITTASSASNASIIINTITSGAPSSLIQISSVTTIIDGFLPTSFFFRTPTIRPVAEVLLCPAFPSCAGPTPTWLESIFTARDLYIPEVTDLGAVPTRKVKQKDDDDDNKAIVFAKIKLPTDICHPLPKPKGGLLGLVANVANKLIDTVIDAACNMEFPVIKGNMPGWLDLTKFPGLTGYTPPSVTKPPPGNPEDPQDPEKSQKSTASPSPTSSQQSSSSSSSSCSSKTFTNCKGTNIISGTSAQAYVTECSTTTACSGTGTMSIVTSTIVPSDSGEAFIHPGPEPGFEEEQECFFKIMESATGVTDEGLAACFANPVDSNTNSTTAPGPKIVSDTLTGLAPTTASTSNKTYAAHTVSSPSGPSLSTTTAGVLTSNSSTSSTPDASTSSNQTKTSSTPSAIGAALSQTSEVESSSQTGSLAALSSLTPAPVAIITFVPEGSLGEAPTPGPAQGPAISFPSIKTDFPPATPTPTPKPQHIPLCHLLPLPFYC